MNNKVLKTIFPFVLICLALVFLGFNQGHKESTSDIHEVASASSRDSVYTEKQMDKKFTNDTKAEHKFRIELSHSMNQLDRVVSTYPTNKFRNFSKDDASKLFDKHTINSSKYFSY